MRLPAPRGRVATAVAVLMLASCAPAGNEPDATDDLGANTGNLVEADNPRGVENPAGVTALNRVSRAPNYDFVEDGIYGYISAISEEDRLKGRAAGDVSTFTYEGQEDGVHRINSVDGDGLVLWYYECRQPCVSIKRFINGRVERLAYSPSSIIGAAFEDAFQGHLIAQVDRKKIVSAARPGERRDVIPAQFRGEWASDPATCQPNIDESFLKINASTIESPEGGEYSVQGVLVQNSRRLSYTIAGWDDTHTLELTGDGLLRDSRASFERVRCTP